MDIVILVLLIASVLLLFLSAFKVNAKHFDLLPMGLALFVLTFLLTAGQKLT